MTEIRGYYIQRHISRIDGSEFWGITDGYGTCLSFDTEAEAVEYAKSH